jgi:hypothetical protein
MFVIPEKAYCCPEYIRATELKVLQRLCLKGNSNEATQKN